MAISAYSAWWFLPFVVPICIYVGFTDMREMRITNQAVVALAIVFLVIGLIALPIADYPWRLLQLAVVLVLCMLFNAAGVMGAGDAKFLAAAAPFIDLGDLRFLIGLLAANILGAFVAHRLAKHSPLRRLAPDWQSWTVGKDFPMGLALGSTLMMYILAGVIWGS